MERHRQELQGLLAQLVTGSNPDSVISGELLTLKQGAMSYEIEVNGPRDEDGWLQANGMCLSWEGLLELAKVILTSEEAWEDLDMDAVEIDLDYARQRVTIRVTEYRS